MKEETAIALMGRDIKYIKKGMDELKKCLKDDYVQKSEFDPVKKIVFGMVTIILVVVVGAIIEVVIN